jgi:hypothetical protein
MQDLRRRNDSEEPNSIVCCWLGFASPDWRGILLRMVLGTGHYLIFDRHLPANLGDVRTRLLVSKLQKV